MKLYFNMFLDVVVIRNGATSFLLPYTYAKDDLTIMQLDMAGSVDAMKREQISR